MALGDGVLDELVAAAVEALAPLHPIEPLSNFIGLKLDTLSVLSNLNCLI